MKVFYDTEFLEDGNSISLISIGMILVPDSRDQNGNVRQAQQYYAVNSEAPWEQIEKHEWLCANVVPSLPLAHPYEKGNYKISIDYLNRCVKPKWVIANEVRDLILDSASSLGEEVELWAWYGAYDHVVLCWLWGPMSELPRGIPMYTHDFKQHVDYTNYQPDISHAEDKHNALSDAKWLMSAFRIYELEMNVAKRHANLDIDATQLIPIVGGRDRPQPFPQS